MLAGTRHDTTLWLLTSTISTRRGSTGSYRVVLQVLGTEGRVIKLDQLGPTEWFLRFMAQRGGSDCHPSHKASSGNAPDSHGSLVK